MKYIPAFIFLFLSGLCLAQEPVMVLPLGHTSNISGLNASPDGALLLTTSAGERTNLWDAKTGRLLRSHESGRQSEFSTDGRYYFVSSSYKIDVYETLTGKKLSNITSSTLWSVAISKNGGMVLAIPNSNSEVVLYETKTGKAVFHSGNTSQFSAQGAHPEASFSSDEKYIIMKNAGDEEAVFPVEGPKIKFRLYGDLENKYLNLTGYDKDNVAVLEEDGNITIHKNPYTRTVTDQSAWLHDIRGRWTNKERSRLITLFLKDNLVRVWSTNPVKLLKVIDPAAMKIISAGIDYQGKYCCLEAENDSFYVWEVNENRKVFSFKADKAEFGSASGWIAFSRKNIAYIMRLEDGRLSHILKGTFGNLRTTVYDPENKTVFTGDDQGIVSAWDMEHGSNIFTRHYQDGPISTITISPDHKKIALGAEDSSFVILDINTGKKIFGMVKCEDKLRLLVFSPDSRSIAAVYGHYSLYTSSGYHTRIYNSSDGSLQCALTNKEYSRWNFHDIVSAEFTRDSRYILTAEDKVLKLWDATTGKLVSVYRLSWVSRAGKYLKTLGWENGEQKVIAARFNPDGQYIFASYADRSYIIWNRYSGKVYKKSKAGKQISSLYESGNDHQLIAWSGKFENFDFLTNTFSPCDSLPDALNLMLKKTGSNLDISDYNKRKELCTLAIIDSCNYIWSIPGQTFMSTRNAARNLGYVKNLTRYDFDQFDLRNNRPDRVLTALGSNDTVLINSYRRAYFKRLSRLGLDTGSIAEANMPLAEIKNASFIPYEQEQEMVLLQFTSSDTVSTLDFFNTWINGVPLFGLRGIDLRGRRIMKFDTAISISLSPGENKIEASVFNDRGAESYRVPVLLKFTPRKTLARKLYFVGIGIDHFSNPAYNLSYSVKDIRDLAMAFKKKFPDAIIDTLFNESVNTKAIDGLRQMLMATKINDIVVIAYSGHGLLSKTLDYYLSTYQVSFENPEISGYPYERLESLLDGIPARQKLVLIDACHSGEVDKDEVFAMNKQAEVMGLTKGSTLLNFPEKQAGFRNSFELMQSLFLNIGKSTGAVIISAASGNQFALERGDLKNGVFTYCILEAFHENKPMMVSELKERVSQRVEEITNGMQKPVARSEAAGVDWEIW
jgi:WD40 repeat protein